MGFLEEFAYNKSTSSLSEHHGEHVPRLTFSMSVSKKRIEHHANQVFIVR